MEFKISSETIGLISEALAKAQGNMGKAIKESLNPHFKSKYADLSSIIEACQKPLSENNLSFCSSVCHINGMNFLIGTLSHSSGEWFRTYLPLVLPKQDMQGLGAAMSYARRFALSALVGVAVGDDDGESIVNHQEPSPQYTQPTGLVSDAQLKYLLSLTDKDTQDKIIKGYQIENLSKLTISQANACIDKAKGSIKNG